MSEFTEQRTARATAGWSDHAMLVAEWLEDHEAPLVAMHCGDVKIAPLCPTLEDIHRPRVRVMVIGQGEVLFIGKADAGRGLIAAVGLDAVADTYGDEAALIVDLRNGDQIQFRLHPAG